MLTIVGWKSFDLFC